MAGKIAATFQSVFLEDERFVFKKAHVDSVPGQRERDPSPAQHGSDIVAVAGEAQYINTGDALIKNLLYTTSRILLKRGCFDSKTFNSV
jgi:hypothetical protein